MLKWSSPVLFGGGWLKYGSPVKAASNAAFTWPPAAHAPSASKVCPRCWRYQWSSSVFPGPVSKPAVLPSAPRIVTLAMPPILTTARLPSAAANAQR